MSVDKIMDFARTLAEQDAAQMAKLEAWEDFIKPRFKKKYGIEILLHLSSMYRKEWQNWIQDQRAEFEINY